jgi:hypothetical protein
MTLLPEFLVWSSNGYTLDHIITAYWYIVLPSTIPVANSGAILRYKWRSDLQGMCLEIQKELPNTEWIIDLAAADTDYWLNPVPG